MPALLFLLHRRRAGLDLFARPDPGLRRGRLWCPFRLQFYCNGHSWLARQLTAAGIGFTLADNAFVRIDDALARRSASGPRSRRLSSGRPKAGPVGPAVLSGVRRLGSVLPLELDAGRVRHRSGVPLASRAQTAL